MKFICGRDALNAVVTDASRAVAARSSMPVLEGIYLKTEDNGRLTVIGNDLEIAIESVIDADVREAVFAFCSREQYPILLMHTTEMTLEDIFLQITGEREVRKA